MQKKIAHYRGLIAYEGTAYKGWQSQKDGQGITDILQQRIEALFGCKPYLVGASRTDAGVHAYGQVAHITLPALYESPWLCKIINDHLPHDIHIRSLEPCEEDFNPRRNVRLKTYHYHIAFQRPLPMHARYVYHHPYPCNHETIIIALQHFVGTHDFASFVTRCSEKETVRTIKTCEAYFLPDMPHVMRVVVQGESFLHHMIRRMVGAALTLASSDEKPERIIAILNAKNPRQRLLNAPAQGLMLMGIEYAGEAPVFERNMPSLFPYSG